MFSILSKKCRKCGKILKNKGNGYVYDANAFKKATQTIISKYHPCLHHSQQNSKQLWQSNALTKIKYCPSCQESEDL